MFAVVYDIDQRLNTQVHPLYLHVHIDTTTQRYHQQQRNHCPFNKTPAVQNTTIQHVQGLVHKGRKNGSALVTVRTQRVKHVPPNHTHVRYHRQDTQHNQHQHTYLQQIESIHLVQQIQRTI